MIKRICNFFSLIIAIFILPFSCLNVHAKNSNIFDMVLIDDDKDYPFTIEFSDKEYKGIIETFAISNNGYIAVGLNDKKIKVYDNNLNFLYSIIPSYTHCNYILDWKDNNLNIYVNSNLLFNCVLVYNIAAYEIYDILNNSQNNSLLNNMCSNVEFVDKNGYIYYISNGQLLRTDKNTNITNIVADNSFFDPMLLLLPLVIPICIYAFKNRKLFVFKYNKHK